MFFSANNFPKELFLERKSFIFGPLFISKTDMTNRAVKATGEAYLEVSCSYALKKSVHLRWPPIKSRDWPFQKGKKNARVQGCWLNTFSFIKGGCFLRYHIRQCPIHLVSRRQFPLFASSRVSQEIGSQRFDFR